MQLINELLRIPSLQQWGYLLQISHRSICSWSSFGPYTPKNNCSKLSSTFWNRHEMEYLPESYLLHIPPPPTQKKAARNNACTHFYHICLLNAHQITSPFMHIISNYIPLPRVIHPSYISRDDFDFIDTIEGALPFIDFLASYQPLSSLHSHWLRIPHFKALVTFSSYILFSPSFALAHL